MKQKISITVNVENLKKIDASVEEGRFRNRSHAVDYSLKKAMEEENETR